MKCPSPSAAGPSTIAPAPSPKRTQVFLSVQSIILESTSAPTTSTFFHTPEAMPPAAIAMEYTPLVHPDCTSKAPAFFASSIPWSLGATPGKSVSGLFVATITISRSSGEMPLLRSASREAFSAIELVSSPSAAIWRLRMPVRSRIHSSLVSTMAVRSWFVSTFSGTYMPVPLIETGTPLKNPMGEPPLP